MNERISMSIDKDTLRILNRMCFVTRKSRSEILRDLINIGEININKNDSNKDLLELKEIQLDEAINEVNRLYNIIDEYKTIDYIKEGEITALINKNELLKNTIEQFNITYDVERGRCMTCRKLLNREKGDGVYYCKKHRKVNKSIFKRGD